MGFRSGMQMGGARLAVPTGMNFERIPSTKVSPIPSGGAMRPAPDTTGPDMGEQWDFQTRMDEREADRKDLETSQRSHALKMAEDAQYWDESRKYQKRQEEHTDTTRRWDKEDKNAFRKQAYSDLVGAFFQKDGIGVHNALRKMNPGYDPADDISITGADGKELNKKKRIGTPDFQFGADGVHVRFPGSDEYAPMTEKQAFGFIAAMSPDREKVVEGMVGHSRKMELAGVKAKGKSVMTPKELHNAAANYADDQARIEAEMPVGSKGGTGKTYGDHYNEFLQQHGGQAAPAAGAGTNLKDGNWHYSEKAGGEVRWDGKGWIAKPKAAKKDTPEQAANRKKHQANIDAQRRKSAGSAMRPAPAPAPKAKPKPAKLTGGMKMLKGVADTAESAGKRAKEALSGQKAKQIASAMAGTDGNKKKKKKKGKKDS